MNALFTPPIPPQAPLLAQAEDLVIDCLANALRADGVDLADEDACRAALIGMGQAPTFVDDYQSTICLVAWQQATAKGDA